MFKRILTCMICAVIIVGCAGREAQKISVVQDGDFARECEELQLEAATNNHQIKSLIIEATKQKKKNTTLTVVSVIVFLPALFALDLKGAAKAEYEALLQRNLHLRSIADSKGCDPIEIKDLEQFKQEIAAEQKAARQS